MAFEYKHLTYTYPHGGVPTSDEVEPFETWLNSWGGAGWELVSLTKLDGVADLNVPTKTECTFKRALNPARAEGRQLSDILTPKGAPARKQTAEDAVRLAQATQDAQRSGKLPRGE